MFSLFKKSVPGKFTYSVQSLKKIDEVKSLIINKIESAGLSLLHTYLYHEIVAEKGFPIDHRVYIYEVCRAKVAASMLKFDASFAPFMPCRISLVENTNGGCILSTPAMETMLSTLPKGELSDEAKELYRTIKTIMEELG